MEAEDLYDLVIDAVREALREHDGGADMAIARRMSAGSVIFRDGEGRTVKEIPAVSLFKKVTAVREKLRVLEQKINNSTALDHHEQAELQGYITRCYGSLTTFNFLFRDDGDRFRGSSS
jgi:hypothetical protein